MKDSKKNVPLKKHFGQCSQTNCNTWGFFRLHQWKIIRKFLMYCNSSAHIVFFKNKDVPDVLPSVRDVGRVASSLTLELYPLSQHGRLVGRVTDDVRLAWRGHIRGYYSNCYFITLWLSYIFAKILKVLKTYY